MHEHDKVRNAIEHYNLCLREREQAIKAMNQATEKVKRANEAITKSKQGVTQKMRLCGKTKAIYDGMMYTVDPSESDLCITVTEFHGLLLDDQSKSKEDTPTESQ